MDILPLHLWKSGRIIENFWDRKWTEDRNRDSLVNYSDLSFDRGGRCFSRNDVISSNRFSSNFKMASLASWMRMSSAGCVAEDSTKHVSPPAYTRCTWCLGVGASTVETSVGVDSFVCVPKPSCPFAPRPHDNRREDDVTNKRVWRLKIEQSIYLWEYWR